MKIQGTSRQNKISSQEKIKQLKSYSDGWLFGHITKVIRAVRVRNSLSLNTADRAFTSLSEMGENGPN